MNATAFPATGFAAAFDFRVLSFSQSFVLCEKIEVGARIEIAEKITANLNVRVSSAMFI